MRKRRRGDWYKRVQTTCLYHVDHTGLSNTAPYDETIGFEEVWGEAMLVSGRGIFSHLTVIYSSLSTNVA